MATDSDAIGNDGSNDVRRSPKRSHWIDAAPLVALTVLAFCLACVPLQSFDIWWHLRTGETILETGTIPRIDVYTYSDAGRPWVDLHWGFQILVAWLHRWGGIPTLVLAKAVCLSVAIALGWAAGGRGLPGWSRTLLWTLPVLCVMDRPWVRPEMLSHVALAFWLFVLVRSDDWPRAMWLLPAAMLVWVNCHALFVLGFVALGATAIDLAVRRFAPVESVFGPRPSSRTLRTFAAASALSVVAATVNPYGLEGTLFPWTLQRKFTVDQEYYAQRVGEFTPLSNLLREQWPSNPFVLAETVLFFATVASFVWLAMAARRVPIGRLLMFAAFAWLAWKAWRNIAPFGIVAGIVCCENMADALRTWRSRRQPGLGSTASMDESRSRWATFAVVVFCLAWTAAVVSDVWADGIRQPYRRFGVGMAERHYVHDAAEFAGHPGFPEFAFVTNFAQAGVYLYHNAPERRVFLDGRLEVASLETFQAYFDVVDDIEFRRPNWERRIITPDGSLPAMIFDNGARRKILVQRMQELPQWRLVYVSPTSAVYFPTPIADELELFEPVIGED